jgi:selenocysteine lyase/cysteine desulfurase
MEPAACRIFFPALEKQVFLNHAGIAPCSTRVIAAMRTVLTEQANLGSAGYRLWTERVAAVRRQAAAFIGAAAEEVAFVPNTSSGLSLVAAALPWQAGEAVLVPTPDFPANVYPWWHLSRRGVRIIDVPRRDGRLEVADLARALHPDARVLALSSVDFATGFAADLPAIGSICREHDLLLVVDAIQSLGVLPLDVKRCGIHALAAGAHKWLCGPQGIGVLYIDRNLLPQLTPPLVGWKSVADEETFALHFDLRRDAAGFEPGTLDVAGIAGLGAALELLTEVGSARIRAQVTTLTGQLGAGLEQRGWRLVSPRQGSDQAGIVACTGSANPQEVFRHLAANDIIVALRHGNLRLSPHFANNAGDIVNFFAVLDSFGRN